MADFLSSPGLLLEVIELSDEEWSDLEFSDEGCPCLNLSGSDCLKLLDESWSDSDFSCLELSECDLSNIDLSSCVSCSFIEFSISFFLLTSFNILSLFNLSNLDFSFLFLSSSASSATSFSLLFERANLKNSFSSSDDILDSGKSFEAKFVIHFAFGFSINSSMYCANKKWGFAPWTFSCSKQAKSWSFFISFAKSSSSFKDNEFRLFNKIWLQTTASCHFSPSFGLIWTAIWSNKAFLKSSRKALFWPAILFNKRMSFSEGKFGQKLLKKDITSFRSTSIGSDKFTSELTTESDNATIESK